MTDERKDEVLRNSEIIVNGYIALVRELETKGFVPKKQPVTEDLFDHLADCKEALSTEGECKHENTRTITELNTFPYGDDIKKKVCMDCAKVLSIEGETE